VVVRVVVASGILAAVLACVPQPLQENCVGDPITGVRNETFVTDSGETTRPRDLSQATVEVLLPKAAGGFNVCPGSGASDGTFTVPDVPNVPYYLHIGGFYFVTRERTLDVSITTLGRPDVPAPPTSTTRLAIKVDNLNPWVEAQDALQLFSMSARSFSFGPQARSTAPPSEGAEALDFSLDWSNEGANLIQGSAGDRTFLTQLTQKAAVDGQFLSIERVLSTSSLTLRSGLTSTLMDTFDSAPPPELIDSFIWKRSLFDDAVSAADPGATATLDEFFVFPQPGGADRGQYSAVPTLMLGFPVLGSFDTDLIGYEIANPFPSSWPVLAEVAKVYAQERVVPGFGPLTFTPAILVEDRLARMTGTTVSPLVGPVLGLRLDGASAYQDRSITDETPTLTWTRPTPAPDQVMVFVVHLTTDKTTGAAATETVALLRTQESQIRIPPGLLEVGGSYVFFVSAMVATGADLVHTPTANAIPFGQADVLTAVMTRQGESP
jgi:hypothetical protein